MTARDQVPLERLLVATDGEPAADAALHLGKLLAERHGADVQVVGVFCPRIPVPSLASDVRRCESPDRRAVVRLRRRIRQQVRERIGASWPIHLCVGHPPARILELARAMRASLVLLGHTEPNEMTEHRLGRHTAEQIAIGCDIPVLTVPPGLNELPRLIVAVNDNSAASERALKTAAAILADNGTLRESEESVGRSMLHHAEAAGAELVVLPLRGDTSTTRALMGGSVMDVLDHAQCAVLITPAAA